MEKCYFLWVKSNSANFAYLTYDGDMYIIILEECFAAIE